MGKTKRKMSKTMILLGKLTLLVGLSCFANSGMSMLRFRRHALQDESIEEYHVPLDVKIEVIAGLLLCVLGALAIFTSDLMIISGLFYYDKKTSAQFHQRRNFRSVRNTRGNLFKNATNAPGANKIPSVEDILGRSPHIK